MTPYIAISGAKFAMCDPYIAISAAKVAIGGAGVAMNEGRPLVLRFL